jgi:hypothetical protein
MMMRIVLMGPLRSTFVQTDIAELGKVHDIVPFDTVLGKGAGGFVTLLRLTLSVLLALPKADALYCWFADYHTLIPTIIYRLLGKKVYVVAGGYDVGYRNSTTVLACAPHVGSVQAGPFDMPAWCCL